MTRPQSSGNHGRVRRPTQRLPLMAQTPLLLLLLLAGSLLPAAVCARARAGARAMHSISASTRSLRGSGGGGGGGGRSLVALPCCEDCSQTGTDQTAFACFQNCQHCVSGSDCLQWTADVADSVAQAACYTAYSQCPNTYDYASAVAQAVAQAYPVTRKACIQAANNVCLTDARSYAQSGGSGCQAYNTGIGSCNAYEFQQYFESALSSLCQQVANGVAVSLP